MVLMLTIVVWGCNGDSGPLDPSPNPSPNPASSSTQTQARSAEDSPEEKTPSPEEGGGKKDDGKSDPEPAPPAGDEQESPNPPAEETPAPNPPTGNEPDGVSCKGLLMPGPLNGKIAWDTTSFVTHEVPQGAISFTIKNVAPYYCEGVVPFWKMPVPYREAGWTNQTLLQLEHVKLAANSSTTVSFTPPCGSYLQLDVHGGVTPEMAGPNGGNIHPENLVYVNDSHLLIKTPACGEEPPPPPTCEAIGIAANISPETILDDQGTHSAFRIEASWNGDGTLTANDGNGKEVVMTQSSRVFATSYPRGTEDKTYTVTFVYNGESASACKFTEEIMVPKKTPPPPPPPTCEEIGLSITPVGNLDIWDWETGVQEFNISWSGPGSAMVEWGDGTSDTYNSPGAVSHAFPRVLGSDTNYTIVVKYNGESGGDCVAEASVLVPQQPPVSCEELFPKSVSIGLTGALQTSLKDDGVLVWAGYGVQYTDGEWIGIWWQNGNDHRIKEKAYISKKGCQSPPESGGLEWRSYAKSHLLTEGAKYYIIRWTGSEPSSLSSPNILEVKEVDYIIDVPTP